MCWNEQVSLNTFLFSCFGIFLAAGNGYNIYVLILLASFVLMQLNEYFLWKYLATKSFANILFTKLTCVLIMLQPIASILLLHDQKQLMWRFLIAYAILGSVTIVVLSQKPASHFISHVGKNGHLVWNWIAKKNVHWYAIAIYFIFLIIPMVLTKEYFILALVLVTLFLSLYYFVKYDTWGSMWCWMANIIMIVIVIKILLPVKDCMFPSLKCSP